MRITHYGHACLLLEYADARICFDPGDFADDFSGLRDLDAIVFTHQHPDHLDKERVPDLVRANPGADILCDPDTVAVLAGLGIEGRTHDGAETVIQGATLTPFGDKHALIHEEIPLISNVGVRLSADGEPTFFHPGDALDAEPGHVDVLAFPLNAPWQRSREMTAFLRRFNAPYAVPIHDGLLQQRGRRLYLTQAENLGGADTTVRDLAGAGPSEFSG